MIGILKNLLPRVVAYSAFERTVMRCLFAVLVFFTISWGRRFDGQPSPTGLAHWFDLTFVTQHGNERVFQVLVVVSLVLYVLRIVPVLALLVPTLVTVAVGTAVNSQGATNHDTQAVAMVLIGQLVVFVTAGLAMGKKGWFRPGAKWETVAVHVSKCILVAVYVVSACVKLDESDGKWISEGVPRLGVQMLKTNYSKYYSDLTPVDPLGGESVPRWISEHPWQAKALFGSGLILEFLFFLALANRRWGFVLGLAMMALHLIIGRLMYLHFSHHLALLLIYFINVPGMLAMWRERRAATTVTALPAVTDEDALPAE